MMCTKAKERRPLLTFCASFVCSKERDRKDKSSRQQQQQQQKLKKIEKVRKEQLKIVIFSNCSLKSGRNLPWRRHMASFMLDFFISRVDETRGGKEVRGLVCCGEAGTRCQIHSFGTESVASILWAAIDYLFFSVLSKCVWRNVFLFVIGEWLAARAEPTALKPKKRLTPLTPPYRLANSVHSSCQVVKSNQDLANLNTVKSLKTGSFINFRFSREEGSRRQWGVIYATFTLVHSLSLSSLRSRGKVHLDSIYDFILNWMKELVPSFAKAEKYEAPTTSRADAMSVCRRVANPNWKYLFSNQCQQPSILFQLHNAIVWGQSERIHKTEQLDHCLQRWQRNHVSYITRGS